MHDSIFSMGVNLTIWTSDEEEYKQVRNLLREATALYVLVHGANIREIDVVKEALKQYIAKLKEQLK